LVSFFEGFNIQKDKIVLIQNQEGRFSGMAYVVFDTEEEKKRAILEKNLKYIGSRYVELKEFM
jgi:hypothetical protein